MPDHLARFIPAVSVGLSLLLVGVLNVLLVRRGAGVRAVASLLGLGVGVGVAAAVDADGTTPATLLLLAVMVPPWFLLGSRWLTRRAAGVVALFHRPVLRSGLLTAGGLGLLLHAIVVFERADTAAADANWAELELAAGRVPSRPVPRPPTTDRGRPVPVREAVHRRQAEELEQAEAAYLRVVSLETQVIRRGPADERSNCHGWVFTGGRFLLGPEDVITILRENGYEQVDEPEPGDLAIYRTSGSVTHTGVVRYVADAQPVMVEGKWGSYGVFLHPVDRCPYGTEYTFYRSRRDGHLITDPDARPIE